MEKCNCNPNIQERWQNTPKITEVSIFLIPAIRYTLKYLIWIQIYWELMTETQIRFWKGRSCTDPTFCLKLLTEKWREYNLETYLLFIDYEEAFDWVQKHILFDILKSRSIPDTLLKVIVDIHTQNKNKISIKFNSISSKLPEINREVRHGCPLTYTV
jgi:hypothetical protein